jgi:hypothetical protein
MSRQCVICGTRLYDDEERSGVCDFCRDDPDRLKQAWERSGRWGGPGPGRPPRDRQPRGGPAWGAFKVGVALLSAVVVLDLVHALVGGLLELPGERDLVEGFAPMLWLGRLVIVLLLLTALGLFCAAPSDSGLRGLAWAVNGCLLAFLIGLGFELMASRSGDLVRDLFEVSPKRREAIMLGGLCVLGLLLLGGYICLGALLSGAARRLDDARLAGGFVLWFIVAALGPIAIGAIWFGASSSILSDTSGDPEMVYFLHAFGLCGGFVLRLIFTIWIVVLLGRLRKLMG